MYDPVPQRAFLRLYPKPVENGVTEEMKVAGVYAAAELADRSDVTPTSFVEAVWLAMEVARATPGKAA